MMSGEPLTPGTECYHVKMSRILIIFFCMCIFFTRGFSAFLKVVAVKQSGAILAAH